MTTVSPYFEYELKERPNGLTFVSYHLVVGETKHLWRGEAYLEQFRTDIERMAADRCLELYTDWMNAGGVVKNFEVAKGGSE